MELNRLQPLDVTVWLLLVCKKKPVGTPVTLADSLYEVCLQEIILVVIIILDWIFSFEEYNYLGTSYREKWTSVDEVISSCFQDQTQICFTVITVINCVGSYILFWCEF